MLSSNRKLFCQLFRDKFAKFILELSSGADLDLGEAEAHAYDHESVTARWILSNLNSTLQHHLSYCCKIRKHGTPLYRSNGDLLTSLTIALSAQNKPINNEPIAIMQFNICMQ